MGQSAKIEQTGSLGLTVGRGDLDRTMTQLTALAGAYGGFVANSQTQSGAGTGGAPSGSITLQVPVDNFATVLKQAQALGKTSTSRRRPPTSRASTSTCRRASPRSRPAASST